MELVDFNRFVWRQDPSVPGRHLREAGGAEVIEDIWNLTKQGEQNLFLGIYATLSTPLDADKLFVLVRSAWRSLRWDIPIIAASTAHIWHGEGKVPTTLITYDEAKSEEDVDGWVSETTEIFPAYGAEKKTLDDLRYDIGQGPIPANDYDRQTFLYLIPYSETKFGLLLRTSHVPVDGSGVKIMMTKLLGHLASYIVDQAGYTESENARMKWGTGKEATSLLPMITEILRQDEPEVRDEQGKLISEATKAEPRDGPDFKSFIEPPFDPKTSQPKTRRFEHRFTVEESIAIHAAGGIGKNGNTEKFTVNHLVHGALSLLPLYDNPPPPDTSALVFYYGLVDGRQHLRKDYRDPLAYPAYCLGMSGLHIDASLFNKFPKEDKKGLVLAYAKEVKREYMKQAAYPSLVAIEPQQADLMLSAAPPPPPWLGPAYAADGKGAVYLHPSYVAGSQGKTIIEVDDFFVGLNKCDPGPFFRCTEWKGRMILSVDYNEFAVSDKVIRQWMAQWADLLLAVAA
ncbi:hypothetical protein GALMADRAFT_1335924 [Galerina marginata CBS 339.88]|uniref:Condensation domain-containing protein n=1 Tax=Galerina marginata (strain CBS 339.88) TaxID=685588 RepID=A0A067SSW1_GALM3|nr:hypothetical protein GALMADRAFT_1335924 [Galerina marginata CBS 339.88]